jgi:hypothetical protein
LGGSGILPGSRKLSSQIRRDRTRVGPKDKKIIEIANSDFGNWDPSDRIYLDDVGTNSDLTEYV